VKNVLFWKLREPNKVVGPRNLGKRRLWSAQGYNQSMLWIVVSGRE